MSDIYLSLTETPTVVTLSQPVISGALSSTVTVANTVTVALDANSLSALENVTVTVGAAVSISNFPSVTTVTGSVALAAGSAQVGSVTVSNFPPTQTIAGTVTANIASDLLDEIASYGSATKKLAVQIYDSGGNAIGESYLPVYAPDALPISGTVTVSNAITASQFYTVVTSGNLGIPLSTGVTSSAFQTGTDYDFVIIRIDSAVSGVTAPSVIINTGTSAGSAENPSGNRYGGFWRAWNDTEKTTFNFNSTNIYSAVTKSNKTLIFPSPNKENRYFWLNAINLFGSVPVGSVDFYACKGLTPQVATDVTDGLMMAGKVPVAGNVWVSNSSVTVGNSVTIGSLPAISGTVTANGGNFASATTNAPSHSIQLGWNETLYGYGFRAVNNDGDELPVRPVGAIEVGTLPAISGTVTAAAPNGSLTTRFGTPTTANTAFATAAVTKSDRKYLLIQNVTTGSNVITVGIGFTPTTTQGIQLTAGAGITFESSYIPTGQIFVLSSVTASNFTILEA